MFARQRVHDLGVCKAIGMTPRQILTMITSWILAPGLAVAAIALPTGIALEHAVATAIVNAQTSQLSQVVPPGVAGRASQRLPTSSGHARVLFAAGSNRRERVIDARAGGPSEAVGLPDAYNPGTLALVVVAGLAIATLGALLPASWAAVSNTTTALRTE
jgi:putative ABC transport system permease protein